MGIGEVSLDTDADRRPWTRSSLRAPGGDGTPPNPCGIDAPAFCNPTGGGGPNPGSAPAPGGGNSGTSTATSTSSGIYACSKFGCTNTAAQVAQWAASNQTPGGWEGFLGGIGSFFTGTAESAACAGPVAAEACLVYQAVGGEMPSTLYKNWLASRGVDISLDSTYGDGIITMSILTLALGGPADAGSGVTVADNAEAASVALDSGAARALSSADRSVANRLISQMGGSRMIMSQTAADEFQLAAARLAGPLEKGYADDLMSQVQVVPDNPSAAAAALQTTRRVGANDIQIFGTADNMGIPIYTSDMNFLRGASAQGVGFDAIVHPPMSFLGY